MEKALKSALDKTLRAPQRVVMEGLHGSARYFPTVAVAKENKGYVHLFIDKDNTESSYAVADFTTLLGHEQVYYYPATYRGKEHTKRSDASFQVQRTAALQALSRWNPSDGDLVLVTYPEALGEGIPNKTTFEKNCLVIHQGEALSHQFVKECFFSFGFEKVDFVSQPGQFAVRGSIIDVFSFLENQPYRINFFGDEVEDLRLFDTNTQRSIEKRQEITIAPLVEGTVSLWDTLPAAATLVWTYPALMESVPDAFSAFILGREIASEPTLIPTLTLTYDTVPQPVFHKNFELLVRDIKQKQALGYTVSILSDNPAQITRIEEIFQSLGCAPRWVRYLPYALNEGFIDHLRKECYYTDHQLFQRLHRVTLKRAVQKSEQLTINDLKGFRLGDYVIHIDHGVGIFGGLVKTEINGQKQEVIKLIYRDNDVLFVNIHALHRIAKYKSKDSTPPKINKLGTGAWNKLKQQTKKKVKDIAQDLIRLYSERQATAGFAYDPDTYLQHELEASFLFEDTPDQLKATEDVKHDMEQPCPMDRLVCGDVGFGKTEVAIRAAFKAVSNSKQVAVLVPTTILALQHYRTFSKRLEDFPAKVEFLSRLKSAAETKEIAAKLKQGTIDILIGTHRIFNKEIEFKDLGLLIIDEEQKFGVAAKEKLRQLKIHVDTLTLTATPIPRTLQFSLMGARDLSIIQTPPLNRLPIQTEVHPFNELVIRDAIMQEIDRGGQVFFVHNRVSNIEEMAQKLRDICPNLRIAIGHGQMAPKDLEKVLLGFVYGDYDLLLATSIIENGIDIPNANTIIINRAHTFGLSDLHQMRGRVGRSNKKAYCYLLVPEGIELSDDARRRLKAIEAFTELGNGFNIAMQDLDIRGAGNLLGGEQSGFIADMGFETYQRILEEAFAELNEQREATASHEATSPTAAVTDVTTASAHPMVPSTFLTDSTIETDLEVLIPDEYLSNVTEKIRLYKELDNMKDEQKLQQFFEALADRYGPPPPQVIQLGYVVRLRRLAVTLGFERIVLKNGIMLAYFIHNQQSNYYKSPLFAGILSQIQKHPGKVRLKEQNEKLFVRAEEVKSVESAYNLMIYFGRN